MTIGSVGGSQSERLKFAGFEKFNSAPSASTFVRKNPESTASVQNFGPPHRSEFSQKNKESGVTKQTNPPTDGVLDPDRWGNGGALVGGTVLGVLGGFGGSLWGTAGTSPEHNNPEVQKQAMWAGAGLGVGLGATAGYVVASNMARGANWVTSYIHRNSNNAAGGQEVFEMGSVGGSSLSGNSRF